MDATHDHDYSSLTVRGNDALSFLQGQLTNDLSRLDAGKHMLAAWCNPKGRVICLFHVGRDDDGFVLTLPDDLAGAVQDRLAMFRFRAKVEFGRVAATAADLGAPGSIQDWRLDNLRAGIPDIRTAQSESFTPHMLNLDLQDAISFDKGCYTGQEIVARTHYRGATKRRMFRFESETPVAEGHDVLDGDRKIGVVVNVIDKDLLAVIPVDSRDADLSVDGIPLTRIALPYELRQVPV